LFVYSSFSVAIFLCVLPNSHICPFYLIIFEVAIKFLLAVLSFPPYLWYSCKSSCDVVLVSRILVYSYGDFFLATAQYSNGEKMRDIPTIEFLHFMRPSYK
jgi:hypothetical protein